MVLGKKVAATRYGAQPPLPPALCIVLESLKPIPRFQCGAPSCYDYWRTNNAVNLLETELGNGQTNHALIINFQPPPGQEIERRPGPRDTSAAAGPYAIAHLLAMKHRDQHRPHRFHQPPRVPGPAGTDLHIGGIAGLRMETRIDQDNHAVVTLDNQGVKMRGVDVRGGTVPGADQALLVHDETEFVTHNPPMIAFPLLAYLGQAASLPHGVDQRDALAVRHPQQRRRCQKAGGPRRVGLEEPGQAGPLRHLGKQRQRVARQPAIERAHPAAFDRI
jgi:hypothetical protein